MIEEPFQYQKGIKKMICNCNRNFTISRVCLDLQYYSPISIKFKGEDLLLTPEKLLDHGLVHQIICSDPNQVSQFGRKIALGLTQGFKMNKKFANAIIISKAPEVYIYIYIYVCMYYLFISSMCYKMFEFFILYFNLDLVASF